MTRRGRVWPALVAALAFAFVGAPGVSARTDGPAPLSCEALAVAPEAQVAPGLMCIHVQTTFSNVAGEETRRSLQVLVSHDGGHDWTPRTGAGLPGITEVDAPPRNPAGYAGDLGSTPIQVIYSADYVSNHTIYLAVAAEGAGLYATTDDGATWQLAAEIPSDLTASYTPYVDGTAGPGGLQLFHAPIAVGGEGATHPLRVDAPLVRSEPGANPAASRSFLFSGKPYHGTSLLDFAYEQSSTGPVFSHDVSTLRSCTLDLDCSTVLHRFPPGVFLGSVVLAGDYSRTGRVLVDAWANDGAPSASPGWLESTDGGRRFHAWRRAPWLRGPEPQPCAGDGLGSGVAANPQRPGHLAVVALVDGNCQPQQSRVYYSPDDGRQWQLSYTADREPWGNGFFHSLLMGPTGRLYALVDQTHPSWRDSAFVRPYTVWCSVDDGRHWQSPCAR